MLELAELPLAIDDETDSRLRYLCTRGFPLMAAILTGLLPGLIMSLVLLSTWPLFRIPFEVVPLRPVLPLSNENETSESEY